MVLIRGVHVWIEIGTSLDDGLLEKGWKASQRARTCYFHYVTWYQQNIRQISIESLL